MKRVWIFAKADENDRWSVDVESKGTGDEDLKAILEYITKKINNKKHEHQGIQGRQQYRVRPQ